MLALSPPISANVWRILAHVGPNWTNFGQPRPGSGQVRSTSARFGHLSPKNSQVRPNLPVGMRKWSCVAIAHVRALFVVRG